MLELYNVISVDDARKMTIEGVKDIYVKETMNTIGSRILDAVCLGKSELILEKNSISFNNLYFSDVIDYLKNLKYTVDEKTDTVIITWG